MHGLPFGSRVSVVTPTDRCSPLPRTAGHAITSPEPVNHSRCDTSRYTALSASAGNDRDLDRAYACTPLRILHPHTAALAQSGPDSIFAQAMSQHSGPYALIPTRLSQCMRTTLSCLGTDRARNDKRHTPTSCGSRSACAALQKHCSVRNAGET